MGSIDMDEFYLPYPVWERGTLQWFSPILDSLVILPKGAVGHA